MHTRNIIPIFNPICIFKFAFKCMLMSLNVFVSVFKTHIFNMIKFILIKIRLKIFRCFPCITYFLIFMQEDFLLHEIQKVIVAREAPENFESDFDKNELYHIENMSLEDTKEKLE